MDVMAPMTARPITHGCDNPKYQPDAAIAAPATTRMIPSAPPTFFANNMWSLLFSSKGAGSQVRLARQPLSLE